MSAVAIIPARGGSRRIPRKNIRLFHGKPILAYSIEAAKACGLFSMILVSTEDEQIGRMAEGYGAQWYPRGAALADDDVGTQEVARDVLLWLLQQGEPYREACCIYATAPTMLAVDILMVHDFSKHLPSSICYIPGWLYWGTAERFLKHPEVEWSDHQVPADTKRWIDINTEEDWARAEQMFTAMGGS